MKILQINSVCGVGSTGRIATDLYKVLEEQGHECLIAYGRGTAPEGINSIRIGSDFDVNVHGVMSRLTDKHGFYTKKATKEFICKIKEYDPDIIHLHNIHGYYINIEELFHYLAESNKPVVWTLHDCWAFTGHCPHFDYIGCDKWKTECYDCPQKKEYPASLCADKSKWNYSKKKELFTSVNKMMVVTPSQWLGNLVKQSFLSKYPVKVINNGINLNVFKPTLSNFREEYQLQNKNIILGVANVWGLHKGLQYLLELANELDDSYQIVIVGVTEKQKLPPNTMGITRTNDVQQLAQIYTAADVFVNPTLEETLGLVNLEALACGTPVITFNTGGSPECIDKTCGIVVEKGNIEGLMQGILLLKNDKINESYCINFANSFDKNMKYQDYIGLYYDQLIPEIYHKEKTI